MIRNATWVSCRNCEHLSGNRTKSYMHTYVSQLGSSRSRCASLRMDPTADALLRCMAEHLDCGYGNFVAYGFEEETERGYGTHLAFFNTVARTLL